MTKAKSKTGDAPSEFHVGTRDLRNALRAVIPHADRTKTGGDGAGTCHRVRLSFGVRELVVMATNLTTSAIAVVDLLHEDGTPIGANGPDLLDAAAAQAPARIVDVVPAKARNLLTNFKAAAHDPEGVAQLLRFDVLGDSVEVTDVSGLFAGDAYVMAFAGNGSGFPDVWGITQQALHAASSVPSPKPLTAHGKHVALFQVASRLYETPLTVEPTGTPESRGFVVLCGDRFVGTISSSHNDDDSLGKRDAARRRWLARFDGRLLAAVQ